MNKREKTEFQNEIVNLIPEKKSGRLHLAPRVGKTRIIIQVIKRDNPQSILWVTPSSELATKDIPAEFEKWGAKKLKNRLDTVTWKSLDKVSKAYDLVILDEEQKITGSHIATLKRLQKYGNILSMTGIPSSSVVKNLIYEELKLEVIYSLTIDEAVEKGVLADYQVNVILVPLEENEDIYVSTKNASFFTSEKKQYQYLTKCVNMFKGTPRGFHTILNRVRAIQNFNSKFKVARRLISKLSGRILVFTSNIDQAERLSPNTYHSKTTNKKLLDFQDEKIEELYMVNSGGIGYTFKNLNHLVVTQVNSDTNGDSSQKITRSLLHQGKGYKATVWILVLEGTQDEAWLESLLTKFNKDKVKKYKNLNEVTWEI